MIQTPVRADSLAQDATFAVLGACQTPGPALAQRAAGLGAGVIAMDRDPVGLAKVVGAAPDKIEGLALVGDPVARLEPLRQTWGDTPLHMVLNLTPLEPVDADSGGIDGQIRGLSALMRALGRGLAAGQGAVVTLLERPQQPLALNAHGMIAAVAAANEALAQVFAPRGIRFYTVTVPEGQAELAVETALFLGATAGRRLRSGRIDLD